MEMYEENTITIDGFTFDVNLLDEEERNMVSDIRKADAVLQELNFQTHVMKKYQQDLLNILGDGLKEKEDAEET